MRRTVLRRFGSWAAAALLAAGCMAPLRAQDPDDQRRGVARVSVVHGDVSVQRGDSGDWVAATVNAPVVTNDRISTGANSRAELQFDGANVLRIGGDAEVSLTQLEYGRYQMAVAHGTVTFRVLRSSNIDIEVDTPSVSVRPSRQGAYRIGVTDAGETEVSVRSGEVEVFSPRGSQWVRSGQTMMARGPVSDPEFQIVRASPRDEWDQWNDSRDQELARSASYRYVGPGVYGVEDLDSYGNWVDVPTYGYVWHPLVVDGWAPYRQGRWVWEDWYGWTWVSYEPWGWAPYHYGRWLFEPAYGWCWYPGVIGARHYWAPALVAFFGFGGGGVSIGFGNVGWVPLAPYEVLHPWWGRGYYGGPAYINRSINITNINVTNIYRNSRVENGVTAVSGEDFRGGRFNNLMRVSSDQLRTAGGVRGPLPIAPDRAHLQFAERQAAFVPRASANTRFFTREQPNPAPRVPFAEQRRTFGQGQPGANPAVARMQPALAPPARAENAAPRFGAPTAGLSAPPAPRTEPATPQGNRGWGRFGSVGSGPRVETPPAGRSAVPPAFAERQQAPPAFRNAPSFGGNPQPERARPEFRDAPSFSGGAPQAPPAFRNAPSFSGNPQPERARPEFRDAPSFGGPAPQPYRPEIRNDPSFGGSRFGQPGRFESPRMSPPVVRERPSGGGFNAPRAQPARSAPSGGDSNRGGGRNR